jgi:hypothetical protein
MPDGDYVIVAVPATYPVLQPGEWDRIARLTALGERMTLGELDARATQLRLFVLGLPP